MADGGDAAAAFDAVYDGATCAYTDGPTEYLTDGGGSRVDEDGGTVYGGYDEYDGTGSAAGQEPLPPVPLDVQLRFPGRFNEDGTIGSACLEPFDAFKQLKGDSQVTLLARKGAGKTTFLHNLLYDIRDREDFIMVVAITVNEDVAMELQRSLPSSVIHLVNPAGDLKAELTRIIEPLMKQGRKLRAAEQDAELARDRAKRLKQYPLPDLLPRRCILVVADDLLRDSTVMNSGACKDMFFSGRHANISCWNLVQEVKNIDKALRKNMDFTMLFNTPSAETIKDTYESMPLGVKSLTEMRELMEEYTQDRGVLVFNGATGGVQTDRGVYAARSRHPRLPAVEGGLPMNWRNGSAAMWSLHYAWVNKVPVLPAHPGTPARDAGEDKRKPSGKKGVRGAPAPRCRSGKQGATRPSGRPKPSAPQGAPSRAKMKAMRAPVLSVAGSTQG